MDPTGLVVELDLRGGQSTEPQARDPARLKDGAFWGHPTQDGPGDPGGNPLEREGDENAEDDRDKGGDTAHQDAKASRGLRAGHGGAEGRGFQGRATFGDPRTIPSEEGRIQRWPLPTQRRALSVPKLARLRLHAFLDLACEIGEFLRFSRFGG
jgi:hypothetical protein